MSGRNASTSAFMSTKQLTAQFGWWGLASRAVTVPWSLVQRTPGCPGAGLGDHGRARGVQERMGVAPDHDRAVCASAGGHVS